MSMHFNDCPPYNWDEEKKRRDDARYNTMLKTAFDFVLEATEKDMERLRRWINQHRPKN